jgi:hypothetical protein
VFVYLLNCMLQFAQKCMHICSIIYFYLLKSVCIFAQLYISVCSKVYVYLLNCIFLFAQKCMCICSIVYCCLLNYVFLFAQKCVNFAQKYLVIYMIFCFDKIYLGLNFFVCGLFIYGMLKSLTVRLNLYEKFRNC